VGSVARIHWIALRALAALIRRIPLRGAGNNVDGLLAGSRAVDARWPLLAVALLLAGCLSGPPAGPVTLPPAGFTHTQVGTGGDTETSLAVSADGRTVLACSHGGFTQPSPWWASTDGGATFTQLEPSPAPPVGGDCDVAIGTDGSWYEVFDSLMSVAIVATHDQGKTWVWSYLNDPLVGNVDRPWIQAVGDDLVVTYADIMADQPYAVFAIRSTDHGATWSLPAVVANVHGPDATNCWVGHPTSIGFQLMLVPLGCWVGAEANVGTVQVQFARSETAGADWVQEPPLALQQARGVPTASFAPDGTLWLAFVAGPDGGHEVMAATSSDDGHSFADPIPVAPIAGDSDWPWIDGRPDGSADVTWMEHAPNGTAGPTYRAHVARVSREPFAVVSSQPIGPSWAGDMSYEFFMVRHDDHGTAFVVHPMDGDGCAVMPLLGPQGSRNRECVHLEREVPAAPAAS